MLGQLVAIDGALKGQVFPILNGDLKIGRGSGSSVAIANDRFVSREHCIVRIADAQFLLEDLDSQNGTFVNGVPVRKRILAHGDQVQTGESVFLFLIPNAEEGDTSPRYVDA